MIRQFRRFLGVGLLATLTHVTTALVVSAASGASSQAANLAGFVAAVGVSYLGHATVTFQGAAAHRAQLPRFAAVSLSGLALSSGITALVGFVGGPFLAAQLLVGLCVPPFTFLGSKFWAFSGRADL